MEPQKSAQPGVVRSIEKMVIGGLLLACIGVMITGVLLRYVMVPITDALDMDAISFFWVEETGEMLQTWLALIGGAVAIAEGAHFTVNFLMHRFSQRAQQIVNVFNCAVIAAFGGLLAWQGWLLTGLNWSLGTPALGISLGWFYAATIVGGLLLIVYALRAMVHPPDHSRGIRVD
jgi:TRAP-type C4-dicarboxylate transport system permease small subunit